MNRDIATKLYNISLSKNEIEVTLYAINGGGKLKFNINAKNISNIETVLDLMNPECIKNNIFNVNNNKLSNKPDMEIS